ncbi:MULTISPECIES: hypothetical protein [Vibrio]|uniref:hypothetical protein n=1 Tax=Vibrio TaxID=662 RepID=UPI002074DF03|nr:MULTISPECIES: hypothetical protein [Vibrio]USD32102.1 hypothetical protein J8Z27_12750 [Vibrio sp. SCSIO 43186]USD35592.1 hypothetical protein J8Z27_22540 [Vibrio sp. SCSIO 43186]USD69227.1 hypothetical protein J4N41_12755 [Vibrio sp. SCSIO 43139]USD72714.1 hypothetical protein J4N41_22535 [Vibrio sp. SCSIO 43139]
MDKSVVVCGLSPECNFGGNRTLVTHLMAIELPAYFSLLPADSKTEGLLKSVHSKLNKDRITEITHSIKLALRNVEKTPFLSLTYVVGGKSSMQTQQKQMVELTYAPKNTLIVGGVLELIAIAKLLGIEPPFYPARRSSVEHMLADSGIRQSLSRLPIQVTMIFNTVSAISFDDMCDYYTKYNARTSQLHSPIQTTMMSNSSINDCVKEIAEKTNLERYGGMTSSSMRLTKSEQGIVAEATLIKLVLGSIAGANAQDKNKVDDFNGRKGVFSEETISTTKQYIILFLKVWLDGISKQIGSDRDGFHYSPSLWLSLGLLIKKIIDTSPINETQASIHRSAQMLAQLGYSKSAEHWNQCKVMDLDLTGQKYKNATGGGRSFRVGLSNYLLTKICNISQSKV